MKIVTPTYHLDHATAGDATPAARSRLHDVKVSPSSKARGGATNINFLDHSIPPSGIDPEARNISALAEIPIPRDIAQLRILPGGLSYYRNLPHLLPK